MAITADGMTATGLILKMKKEGGAYEEVARIVDIQIPSAETEVADVTNQSHSWRHKIPSGIKEAGQASFMVNTLIGDLADAYGDVGTAVDVEVLIPGQSDSIQFSGFIVGFEPGGWALGEKVDHTITIEVNGEVVVDTALGGA